MSRSLPKAFMERVEELEASYLERADPIQRSGFGAGAVRWRAERGPILEAIDRDGHVLDLGCANGYLLECLVAWGLERGLRLVPWGVDVGARLIAEAQERLPDFSDHFFAENVFGFEPPRRFDFVYALFDCVPRDRLEEYVRDLLDRCVAPGGRLILGAYGSRSRGMEPFDVAQFLREIDLEVAGTAEGGDPAITRFAWVDRPLPRNLLDAKPEERNATIVAGVLGVFESALPGRLHSFYQLGSRSDDSAATVGDLDMALVFHGVLDDRERRLALSLTGHLRRISPVRLDLAVFEEDVLVNARDPDVRLKLGGHLVAGEDLRDRIALPDVEAHRAYIVGFSDEFIAVLHDLPVGERVASYPDPTDEFRGYTRLRAQDGSPRGESGTKELVATLCWIATALLSLEAGAFAGTRVEAVRLYALHDPDRFGPLVERAYRRCKLEWDYRVPSSSADRLALRTICDETLALCRHYQRVRAETRGDSSE